MEKITIAIDGFSSTGKSTVAKELANKLMYVYVDSGAMYRAVTLFAMNSKIITESFFNESDLINKLSKIKIEFKFNDVLGFGEMYLNGINVERDIRSLEVSKLVSTVAAIPEVRKILVDQQQEMGKRKGVVMDGRDIGTVVFPNAELKLFMNASAEKRAQRRYDELTDRGDNVTFEEILKNVQHRDHIDTTRDDSPLYKADDAIEVDNSDLGLEEQFNIIYKIVQDRIKES